jgi:glycogen(starch) synthase
MQLLLVTNLYPPQELGGYGRSMADFVWGLQQLGHRVAVLTSDAPYLGEVSTDQLGPNQERVLRNLQLKGDFCEGVRHVVDPVQLTQIDRHNKLQLSSLAMELRPGGVLLGNLDLLGPELLEPLMQLRLPMIHHVGFVAPPFGPDPRAYPFHANYRIAAASQAVRGGLLDAGLPMEEAPVVYPGARCDLFGPPLCDRDLPAPLGPTLSGTPAPQLGSAVHPLRVCFAGLLMSSKGPHTLVEAMVLLRQRGVHVHCSLAGDAFQEAYVEAIRSFLRDHDLEDQVMFCGQLSRAALARFFRLHHVAVFSSTYPEAFGIVAAEAMASGLVLVSTGVGGASELLEDGVSGLRYRPGDAAHLADCLQRLAQAPAERLKQMARCGTERVREHFSVMASARQLAALFGAKDSISSVSFGNITL